MKYDYLIVGAGLFGAICARELTNAGKKCLVIEKRNHIAGNCYTEEINNIQVHAYGAHIFHTSDQKVWEYVNRFAEFNNYVNSPVANYCGKLYNLPFNMNTFYQIWGVISPEETKAKISKQIKDAGITQPKNLEEQAISLVGYDIYVLLIKEYTEKQWGKTCKDLPASIINRLPVRFTFDNNYFNARWQGIPIGGYTALVQKILNGIDVQLNTDYLQCKEGFDRLAEKIIYTGQIDQYFNYRYGPLEWRSLRFETETVECDNYQGVAVMNYTDHETPYTRIIEHKHFEFGTQSTTVITKEYPAKWKMGMDAYYPINDNQNQLLLKQYINLASKEINIYFGGRLGDYKYYDMDTTIAVALAMIKEIVR
jgi:UDP-galactopyranose mutase